MNIYVGNLPFDAGEDDLRQAFAAFGQANNWEVILDNKGTLQALVLKNLSGDIAKAYTSVTITFDADFNPKGKDLSSAETSLFMKSFGGRDALWNYLKSAGKLKIFTPENGHPTADMFGKETRVIVDHGTSIYGRMTASGTDTYFLLEAANTSGPSIQIFAYCELQQIK